MKKIILSGLVFFGMAASAANTLVGIPIESASSLSKLMKPAIEAKDGPAACWFLGQVHGYSLALKNSRVNGGEELFNMVKESAGQCSGTNSSDLTKTFTAEEWVRLSELQKKIEAFKM